MCRSWFKWSLSCLDGKLSRALFRISNVRFGKRVTTKQAPALWRNSLWATSLFTSHCPNPNAHYDRGHVLTRPYRHLFCCVVHMSGVHSDVSSSSLSWTTQKKSHQLSVVEDTFKGSSRINRSLFHMISLVFRRLYRDVFWMVKMLNFNHCHRDAPLIGRNF